jgi:hypothetical protein
MTKKVTYCCAIVLLKLFQMELGTGSVLRNPALDLYVNQSGLLLD